MSGPAWDGRPFGMVKAFTGKYMTEIIFVIGV
jgi:hypothetical protein